MDDEEFDGPLVPFDIENWPGRFERKWVGPERWRTRHGPAIVFWWENEIVRATNVLLDDGSRASVQGPSPGSPTARIANPLGQGFTHGVLMTYPDDVEFVSLTRTYRVPPRDEALPAFEALGRTPEFMRFLEASRARAYACYNTLRNKRLTLPGGAIVPLGERAAAGLVAALRNNGETYLDYFMDHDFYEACLAHLPVLEEIFERSGFAVSDY